MADTHTITRRRRQRRRADLLRRGGVRRAARHRGRARHLSAAHAAVHADQAGRGAHQGARARTQEELVFVQGGFLEVQPHQVTVLADTAIRAQRPGRGQGARGEEARRGGDGEQGRPTEEIGRGAGGARRRARAARGDPQVPPPRRLTRFSGESGHVAAFLLAALAIRAPCTAIRHGKSTRRNVESKADWRAQSDTSRPPA